MERDIWLISLNSPIYSILLWNKFLNLVVVLWIWNFGRSHDLTGYKDNGKRGEFGGK